MIYQSIDDPKYIIRYIQKIKNWNKNIFPDVLFTIVYYVLCTIFFIIYPVDK